MSIPLNITLAGPVPTDPLTLRTDLINSIQTTDPDFTSDLPGSLVEDIVSTGTGILATIDQARVDAVNNLSPYASNPYILPQQGALLGIPQGQPTNTSAYVQFTGPASYVIAPGFVVSDGSHQYVVQDGGVIQTGGTSALLYVVASSSGSWTPAINSITQIVTSIPGTVTLTVTNPSVGTPGQAAELVQSYRSRIMQANQVAGQATPAYIKTLLQAIPGVVGRLVAVKQLSNGWQVITYGGDPYAMAYAVYQGTIGLSYIVGSAINSARNVTTSITDNNDVYSIITVNPPSQSVNVSCTWNTNLPNFVQSAQVNQLATTAITNYINSIGVGQPINLNVMAQAFINSVATVLPQEYISALSWVVDINGVATNPTAGTQIIPSDAESYFLANTITVVQ